MLARAGNTTAGAWSVRKKLKREITKKYEVTISALDVYLKTRANKEMEDRAWWAEEYEERIERLEAVT